MQALDAKYRALYEPLYAQRKDVVLGADGGIPGFWGTVIEHHHLMQEEVTEKDQGVLRHLQDVAWEPIAEEGKEGFKIKFFFEEDNPYFDNAVLEKAYIMKADEDDVLEEAIGTEIAWKKGKNVTVKVMKKKVKKKGKESGPPLTKTVKEDSFFNFFDPPDVAALEGLDDDDEEAIEQLQDLIEEDYEMGCCFKDEIIPHAVHWYTGEAYGSEDEDEDDSEEEEDSEEESDEESDEDDEDDSEDDSEEDDEEEEEEPSPKGKKGKKGKGKKGEQKEQECKQQ